MEKTEIKKEIEYVLDSAWNNKRNARYYLEKLPCMLEGDYDEAVNEFIDKLNYNITCNNKEYYEYNIEDLVEHYFVNQENYDF